MYDVYQFYIKMDQFGLEKRFTWTSEKQKYTTFSLSVTLLQTLQEGLGQNYSNIQILAPDGRSNMSQSNIPILKMSLLFLFNIKI